MSLSLCVYSPSLFLVTGSIIDVTLFFLLLGINTAYCTDHHLTYLGGMVLIRRGSVQTKSETFFIAKSLVGLFTSYLSLHLPLYIHSTAVYYPFSLTLGEAHKPQTWQKSSPNASTRSRRRTLKMYVSTSHHISRKGERRRNFSLEEKQTESICKQATDLSILSQFRWRNNLPSKVRSRTPPPFDPRARDQ